MYIAGARRICFAGYVSMKHVDKSGTLLFASSTFDTHRALAIKSEIQAWMEENKILGELQNGFRQDRRLDDNLFVITQCIEISKAQNRPLWVTFLDIKGAYDNVNRELLWSVLKLQGLEDEVIEFLRAIYKDNRVH